MRGAKIARDVTARYAQLSRTLPLANHGAAGLHRANSTLPQGGALGFEGRGYENIRLMAH